MSEYQSGGQQGEGAPDYEAFAQFDVTLNGYRVHYVDHGQGPPVVLVHGSPVSSYAFRRQIAALSPRFRVIAPDLLGFGRSEVPEGGTSFLQQSQVLRALFDLLDLLDAHHKSGGSAAAKWHYKRGDNDAREMGEEFGEDLSLPFELIPE